MCSAGSQFLDPDGWFPNHVPNPVSGSSRLKSSCLFAGLMTSMPLAPWLPDFLTDTIQAGVSAHGYCSSNIS